MPHDSMTTFRIIARLRQALAGRVVRGAIVGLALLLAGMQLGLRSHLVEHDLLPSNQQVCEHCVLAKGVTPPPSIVAFIPSPQHAAPPLAETASAPTSRAPLIERNRGPPSAA